MELQVRAGAVIALRLFDVAYAIDLAQVEALWKAQGTVGVSRGRLAHTPAKALAFDVPPVALSLPGETLEIGGVPRGAAVSARVYEFGVVAIAIRIPVADHGWADYARLVAATDQRIGHAADAPIWMRILDGLLAVIRPALQRPGAAMLQEDYLYALVQQWHEPLSAAEILERADLASLLADETRPLSDETRRDLLRQRYSYYQDDLVVLTWDRAFVCEPRGDSDVIDVIEVANAQLLEMRYYDELLDDELPRMYDWVEETRRSTYFRAPRRFADLARRLYGLVAEVTELTEKVDNALQVTEDVYLARVYTSALDLLRVPKLSAAVDRKLSIIRDTYTALFDEASASRAELLEVTIVLLIVAEIVLALLKI
ncbi:MAG: hypothetical protein ACREVL_13905 [Solimonas sp.]